jgi:hypothetical protein
MRAPSPAALLIAADSAPMVFVACAAFAIALAWDLLVARLT